jgi:hypothetical protein
MNTKPLYFDCENIDSLHQHHGWWRILERRIAFYERRGAAILPCTYILPSLHPADLLTPMHLMFRPTDQNINLHTEEIPQMIQSLYREKYAAVNGIEDAILDALFAQITGEAK